MTRSRSLPKNQHTDGDTLSSQSTEKQQRLRKELIDDHNLILQTGHVGFGNSNPCKDEAVTESTQNPTSFNSVDVSVQIQTEVDKGASNNDSLSPPGKPETCHFDLGDPRQKFPYFIVCNSCRSGDIVYEATCQNCKIVYKTQNNRQDISTVRVERQKFKKPTLSLINPYISHKKVKEHMNKKIKVEKICIEQFFNKLKEWHEYGKLSQRGSQCSETSHADIMSHNCQNNDEATVGSLPFENKSKKTATFIKTESPDINDRRRPRKRSRSRGKRSSTTNAGRRQDPDKIIERPKHNVEQISDKLRERCHEYEMGRERTVNIDYSQKLKTHHSHADKSHGDNLRCASCKSRQGQLKNHKQKSSRRPAHRAPRSPRSHRHSNHAKRHESSNANNTRKENYNKKKNAHAYSHDRDITKKRRSFRRESAEVSRHDRIEARPFGERRRRSYRQRRGPRRETHYKCESFSRPCGHSPHVFPRWLHKMYVLDPLISRRKRKDVLSSSARYSTIKSTLNNKFGIRGAAGFGDKFKARRSYSCSVATFENVISKPTGIRKRPSKKYRFEAKTTRSLNDVSNISRSDKMVGKKYDFRGHYNYRMNGPPRTVSGVVRGKGGCGNKNTNHMAIASSHVSNSVMPLTELKRHSQPLSKTVDKILVTKVEKRFYAKRFKNKRKHSPKNKKPINICVTKTIAGMEAFTQIESQRVITPSSFQSDKQNLLEKVEELCNCMPPLSPLSDSWMDKDTPEILKSEQCIVTVDNMITNRCLVQSVTNQTSEEQTITSDDICKHESNNEHDQKNLVHQDKITSISSDPVKQDSSSSSKPYESLSDPDWDVIKSCFYFSENGVLMLDGNLTLDVNNNNGGKNDSENDSSKDTAPTTSACLGDDFESIDFPFKYDILHSPVVLNAPDRIYHVKSISNESASANTCTKTMPAIDNNVDLSTILSQVRKSDDILATAMESAGLTDSAVVSFLDDTVDLDSVIFEENTTSVIGKPDDADTFLDQIFNCFHPQEDSVVLESENTYVLGNGNHVIKLERSMMPGPTQGYNISIDGFEHRLPPPSAVPRVHCGDQMQDSKNWYLKANSADTTGAELGSRHSTIISNNVVTQQHSVDTEETVACVNPSFPSGALCQSHSNEITPIHSFESVRSGENKCTAASFQEKNHTVENMSFVSRLNKESLKNRPKPRTRLVTARPLDFESSDFSVITCRREPRKSKRKVRQRKASPQSQSATPEKAKPTEKIKDVVTYRLGTSTSTSTTSSQPEGQAGNVSRNDYRKPQAMLRRRLRSRTVKNVTFSPLNTLILPTANSKHSMTDFVNSNNNSDSLNSSCSDLSDEQPGSSSSTTETREKRKQQLAATLRKRCKELEKQYRQRYENPSGSTFRNMMTPTSGVQSNPQISKHVKEKNAKRVKTCHGKPRKIVKKSDSIASSDMKSKGSVLKFVSRIRGGYGDQFPVSSTITKEKRNELCNKYLRHHHMELADTTFLKRLGQSQKNDLTHLHEQSSEERISTTCTSENLHEKEFIKVKEPKVTNEDRPTPTASIQSCDTSRRDDTNVATCLGSHENVGEIETKLTNYNESYNRAGKKEEKPKKVKSSVKTGVGYTTSASSSSSHSSNTASGTRLCKRSTSPRHKLLTRIEKFERDFQTRFSTAFQESSNENDTASSCRRSVSPKSKRSSKRPKKPQASAPNKTEHRKKLFDILKKFENLDLSSSSNISNTALDVSATFEAEKKTEGPLINCDQDAPHNNHGTACSEEIPSRPSVFYQKMKSTCGDDLPSTSPKLQKLSTHEIDKRASLLSGNGLDVNDKTSEENNQSTKDGKIINSPLGLCPEKWSDFGWSTQNSKISNVKDTTVGKKGMTLSTPTISHSQSPTLETQHRLPLIERQCLPAFEPRSLSYPDISLITAVNEGSDFKLPPISSSDKNLTLSLDREDDLDVSSSGPNEGIGGSSSDMATTVSKSQDRKDPSPSEDKSEPDPFHGLCVSDENLIDSILAENAKIRDGTLLHSEIQNFLATDNIGPFVEDEKTQATNQKDELATKLEENSEVHAFSTFTEANAYQERDTGYDLELNTFRSLLEYEEPPKARQSLLYDAKCSLLSPIPEESDEEVANSM